MVKGTQKAAGGSERARVMHTLGLRSSSRLKEITKPACPANWGPTNAIGLVSQGFIQITGHLK